jgi:hypothetical protein
MGMGHQAEDQPALPDLRYTSETESHDCRVEAAAQPRRRLRAPNAARR